jgi:cytosine/adenosine deaminase-related metal-dependent hydrolase
MTPAAFTRLPFAVPILDRNPLTYGEPAPLLERLAEADRAVLARRGAGRRSGTEQLALVDEIARFEHELFTVQYGPVGPQWVTDATLEAIAGASIDTGRRVHMHLFETRYQTEWAAAAYPGGLIGHLDAIGLLSPRLTVAHGVWLSAEDCARLAERGVTVSVNPSSNLRLKSGIAPVGRFLETGLAFGLGLDGMAFDDDEDALRELRLLWQLNRGLGAETVLDEQRLFRAACVDGRRTVVGDDGGGVIAPGAPADLMLLDFDAMAPDLLDGAADPLDVVLARMTKRHLDTLVVAGRTVVANGACTGVDRPALEAELWAQARTAWANRGDDGDLGDRLAAAIADYYRCGCHRTPAPQDRGDGR